MKIILIIIFPFLAALAGYIFRKGKAWPHLLGAGGSLIATFILWIRLGNNETLRLNVMDYGEFTSYLIIDYTTALLAVVVAFVALIIFIYASSYMRHESGKAWFWPAMSLFLAAMQLLVLAGDWFLFITGWEIMALASFLLIGTWHHNQEARQGAAKAFMITRFTDIGLYAGAFLVIIAYGNLNFPGSGDEKISLMASLWLLLAVMGKSAQIFFQDWLSGAMAGPTPVSALLHSATMVGAGALLVIRIFPVLPEPGLDIIALIGGLTIVITGTTAITSRDIKQMLAASTSSQFGFMLLAAGSGFPGAALAHWLAHAFMKSTLFLGAGVFQHAQGSTLYTKIKGSGGHLKLTFGAFTIAGLALAGIPPLIGYFSKDAILASTFLDGSGFYMITALIGVAFTGIYIAKAIRQLWWGKTQKPEMHGLAWKRTTMWILTLIVLAGGLFLEKWVHTGGYEIPKDILSKYLGLGLAMAGLLLGWIYQEKWLAPKIMKYINANYPIYGGYSHLVVQPVLWMAAKTYQMDQSIQVAIQAAGERVLFISTKSYTAIDHSIEKTTVNIGRAWLRFSEANEAFDKKILGLVEQIGHWTYKTGAHGRKWQTGMVHEELLISIVALLVLILLFTASIITLL